MILSTMTLQADLRVGQLEAGSARSFLGPPLMGFETRQVLAGVAQHMSPEDLVGKKVIVVANLAPQDDGSGKSGHASHGRGP